MKVWVQLDAIQWLFVSSVRSCTLSEDGILVVGYWERCCDSCLRVCLGFLCPWTYLESLGAASGGSTAQARMADLDLGLDLAQTVPGVEDAAHPIVPPSSPVELLDANHRYSGETLTTAKSRGEDSRWAERLAKAEVP